MKPRSILFALALCSGVVFAACALYEAADEATRQAEFEAKLRNLKGDDLTAACTAAKPKLLTNNACQAQITESVTVTLPSGKKRVITAKQFVPGECCATEAQCGASPKFNSSGECRKREGKGTRVPGACCAAACNGAKLDQFGFCRAKDGKFAVSADCCQTECLVFADAPTGEVLCKAENCGKPEAVADTCFCDAECVQFGDCCPNAAVVCELDRNPGGNPGNTSCKDKCGGAGNETETCFCDDQCVKFNDCCHDVFEQCGFRGNRNRDSRGGARTGSCEADDCGNNSKPDGTGCFCDAACVGFGDCCANFATVCPNDVTRDPRGDGARSDIKGQCTEETCGGAADRSSRNSCFCDAQCAQLGDCCDNIEICGLDQRGDNRGNPNRVGGSCNGACGGQSLNGECFCDEQCTAAGDCCADKVDLCAGNGNLPDRAVVPKGSCSAQKCNNAENPKAANGNCFCDDNCAEFGDCCANKAAKCGGPGIDVEVINCGPENCDGAKLDAKGVCRKKGAFADAICCIEKDEKGKPIPLPAAERKRRADAERRARGLTVAPGRTE